MERYKNCEYEMSTIHLIKMWWTIQILSDFVLAYIIEVKAVNFYSSILVSIPDISHIYELAFIFWSSSKWDIKERFLGFLPIEKHELAYYQW